MSGDDAAEGAQALGLCSARAPSSRHLASASADAPPPPVPTASRVEAVQQTLADLTGIPLGDQILMCEGARLDAAKPLSAYGLPGVSWTWGTAQLQAWR